MQVQRSLTQRTRGRGNLTVTSTDASSPRLIMESIPNPDQVAEQVRSLALAARKRHGVGAREMM